MSKRLRVLTAAGVFALAVSCRQAPPAQPAETAKTATTTKFGVEVTGGPMDKVLLKDYDPKPTLVVPQTSVPKARYPAVDVHTRHEELVAGNGDVM